MSAKVARVVGARIQSNALKHKPTTRAGVMVNGAGYQGKTETVCAVAAAFEEQWLALHHHLDPDAVAGTRDLHAPVGYVQTPVTATPKSTCEAILGFYGAPHRGMTLPQLVAATRTSLRDHGTKVLVLDDITRLRMHREADQDVLGLLRSLMSMDVTLILVGVGIPRSGLLREGRADPRSAQWVFPAGGARSFNDEAATQTERRFDLVDLGPFPYDTPDAMAAFVAHLRGIETQLRLFRATPGMLTRGTMPEYLYRRTGGVVGLLERLVEDGCALAIADSTEMLTTDLLDDVELNPGNTPGRDPAAGEIPPVPAPAASKAETPARRPRTTVFDDHGLPEAAVP
jgi:chloramphenicol 3-O-phosphotransferase